MRIRMEQTDVYNPSFEVEHDYVEIDTDAAPTTLEEVYNGVVIRTNEGVEFSVMLRDFGIEVFRRTEEGSVCVCTIEQSLRSAE